MSDYDNNRYTRSKKFEEINEYILIEYNRTQKIGKKIMMTDAILYLDKFGRKVKNKNNMRFKHIDRENMQVIQKDNEDCL